MTPAALVELLAGRLADLPDRARVLVDGGVLSDPAEPVAPVPPGAGGASDVVAADPHRLADALVAPLAVLGRPVLRVRAESYWRDAALRLEHGRTDLESFAGWVDTPALRRELLEPLGPDGDGPWLPSLRDPVTNRSTHQVRRPAPPRALLVLSGQLLATADLPVELTVHLVASPAALARWLPASLSWTIPAHERHARDGAAERADVVVRVEHPDRPAVLGLSTA